MEKQEIYNKVKEHLLKQNERAVDCTNTCLYRTPAGLKCAAGVLLEEGSPAQDSWMGWPSPNQKAQDNGGPDSDLVEQAGEIGHHVFIRELQRIHDLTTPEEWKTKLEKLAILNGLIP